MILLAAVLAAVIGLEIFLLSQDNLEIAKGGSALPAAQRVDVAIEFPPVDHYSEFIERPLFSSTRRAFQPSDKTPLDPSGAVSANNVDLELLGISLSATHKLALIKTKRDNAQHRVGKGEEFRGWRLGEILADKVVMLNGDQLQELALIRKGDPVAAKRKKLQRQQKRSQTGSQPRTAQAQARDKKAQKSPRPKARAQEEAEIEASPAQSESDEEQ